MQQLMQMQQHTAMPASAKHATQHSAFSFESLDQAKKVRVVAKKGLKSMNSVPFNLK